MKERKQKLPNRNVFSDIEDFVKYYRGAMGKNPPRILLTPAAIKQYRKKLKLGEQAELNYYDIPIVENSGENRGNTI